MDSFSLCFSCEVSSSDIVSVISPIGVACAYTSVQVLSVSRGAAQVWLAFMKVGDLPLHAFDRIQEWPLSRKHVLSVVNILVRRNRDSDDLALEIAHTLAQKLGGAISWDGMDYWRNLYNAKYVDQ